VARAAVSEAGPTGVRDRCPRESRGVGRAVEPGVHVAVLAEQGCVLWSERKVRIARVYAGSGLTCRRSVIAFASSIDGSLWYGDLPALVGAETTDIAVALFSEHERRPQHPRTPLVRAAVVRAECRLEADAPSPAGLPLEALLRLLRSR
jgi:hypothetical protein